MIKKEGKKMNCPVCSNTSLVISERQGVEIDYCPKCRGVWLDRGELDKIIERTNEVYDNEKPQNYEDRNYENKKHYFDKKYDDDYYKRNKRKSFFNDLFDF
ncbi:MAG TPA: zf-TFIIB domain-containing protein [Ignavibacteriaceae bacterium]